MPSKPQRIQKGGQRWRPGLDPAAYLIHPGDVRQPGKHKPGNLRHARPYIVSGKQMYVFPVGVEAFRRSGTAQLGLHRYIGHHAVDGRTMHYEEARIELSGTLPGITAQQNMVDCIKVLTSIPPANGMILYAPGVFEYEQYVLPENWDFSHEADDRTHSIAFTISFVRRGTGKEIKDPHGITPPPVPRVKTLPRGKATRVFIAQQNFRTFNQIAAKVFNNSGYWMKLLYANQTLVHRAHLPQHKIPNHRWPLGTKIHY